MDAERDELIKQLAQKGADRQEVRRSLISQGFSTVGFEVVYDALVKDLPSELFKPKPTQPEGRVLNDFESFKQRSLQKNSRRKDFRLLPIVILIMLCVTGILLFEQMTGITVLDPASVLEKIGVRDAESIEKNLNVADKLLQGKVESTAASAHIFGQRTGSYEDVCKDIIPLEGVTCLQALQSATMFVQFSDGSYYCSDTNGFHGNVESKPFSGKNCQEQ